MVGSARALLVSAAVVLAFASAGAPRSEAAPAPGGAVAWERSFAVAAARAQREGKLVLVASTKPGCGLCEVFRNRTAPSCGAELQAVAVPYVYDILRPESPQVDRVVRANLPGARLMPLVGFVTPDLRWAGGFWGQRDAAQFTSDIRRAAPQRAAPITRAAPAPLRTPPSASPALPAAPPVRRPEAPALPAAPRAMASPSVGTALVERPPVPTAPPPSPVTDDELCPGGICTVPTPFDGLVPGPCDVLPPPVDAGAFPTPAPARPTLPPTSTPTAPPSAGSGRVTSTGVADCGVPGATPGRLPEDLLPPPRTKRVEAPTDYAPALAAQPRPQPTYGLPDTEAQRRALERSRHSGSPDGASAPTPAQPLARTPALRSAPAPAAAPAPAPAARATAPRAAPDDSASLRAAEAAAQGGRWGEVLRLADGSPDPRLRDLEVRANRWAQDELDRCVLLGLAGRHEEGLLALQRVRTQMAGSAAGIDAERGLDAIETVRDLRSLSDPQGVLATSLKRNKYDELRGTRWARLFSPQG